MIEAALRHGLWMIIIFSALPLMVSSICGLFVSILQAATQIQEQTITYSIKFGAVCLVLIFGGEWITSELLNFLDQMLKSIVLVGRSS